MTDSLLAAGVALSLAHGFAVSRPDDAGEPPALARPDPTATDAETPTDAEKPTTDAATRPTATDTERTTDDAGSRSTTDNAGSRSTTDNAEAATLSGTIVGGTPPDELFTGPETIAVEPIRDPTPTTVLSRLWNDRNHDRAAVFVAPTRAVADRIVSLLSPPAGIRATDDEGRTFYNGPDRVPLAEGGYAAVPAGTTLEWRETTDVNPDRAVVADDAPDDAATDRTETTGDGSETTTDTVNTTDDSVETGDDGTETSDDGSGVRDDVKTGENRTEPWLVLTADGDPIVGLDGVDALACPPRERFPYNYERDRDKQIRVRDFAGRPVDRYTGIGAMRNAGFQPVPAPLVPDHMFDDVDGSWTVVVAE